MQYKSWEELIENTLVEDIVRDKKKPLIWFDSEVDLRHVLNTLAENDILSAPVISHATGSLMGFVDVLDISGYVLQAWNNHSINLTSDNWRERNYSRNEFFDTKVKLLPNFSQMDQAVGIYRNETVAALLRLFCDPRGFSRLHRLAVLSEDNKIINVVTQSDVITFIAKHVTLLPSRVMTRSLKELGVVHPIVMVRLDSAFYEALQVLYHNRVSGIALLDENGRVSTNLSASDLRGINQKSFNYFTKSTISFLAKGTMCGLKAPISCSEDMLFPDVIRLLYTEAVHRVYITTGGGVPIGVVTMGDVLHLLTHKRVVSST